jgi:hypothetical protein
MVQFLAPLKSSLGSWFLFLGAQRVKKTSFRIGYHSFCIGFLNFQSPSLQGSFLVSGATPVSQKGDATMQSVFQASSENLALLRQLVM